MLSLGLIYVEWPSLHKLSAFPHSWSACKNISGGGTEPPESDLFVSTRPAFKVSRHSSYVEKHNQYLSWLQYKRIEFPYWFTNDFICLDCKANCRIWRLRYHRWSCQSSSWSLQPQHTLRTDLPGYAIINFIEIICWIYLENDHVNCLKKF